MAETSGLVQRLSVLTSTITCVWIGPTPNNTTILVVTNDGTPLDTAFSTSLVHMLATASANYRRVVAVHPDDGATITSLLLEPI